MAASTAAAVGDGTVPAGGRALDAFLSDPVSAPASTTAGLGASGAGVVRTDGERGPRLRIDLGAVVDGGTCGRTTSSEVDAVSFWALVDPPGTTGRPARWPSDPSAAFVADEAGF